MKLWIPAALVSVCGVVAAVENTNMPTDPLATAGDLDLAEVQEPDLEQVHEQVQRELERARREVEAAMREAERTREHAMRQADQTHEQARQQAERQHEQALRQAEQSMRQAERARAQALRETERVERDLQRALMDSQRQAERGGSAQGAEDARRAYAAALGQRDAAPGRGGADERRAVAGLRRELDGLAAAPRAESDAIRSLEQRVAELERRLGITPPAAPRPGSGARAPHAPQMLQAPQPPAHPLPGVGPTRRSSRRSQAPAPSAGGRGAGVSAGSSRSARVLDLGDLEAELAHLPGAITVDLAQLQRQLAELQELDLSELDSDEFLLELEGLEGLEALHFSGVGAGQASGYGFWTSSDCPGCGQADCADCSDDDDCNECEEGDDCCSVQIVFGDDACCEEAETEDLDCGDGCEFEEHAAPAGDAAEFEFDLERFSGPWGDAFPAPEAGEEPAEPVSTQAPSLVGHRAGGQTGLLTLDRLPWSQAAVPGSTPVATGPLMRELADIVDEMRGEVADLRASLRSLRSEVKRAGHTDFDGQL